MWRMPGGVDLGLGGTTFYHSLSTITGWWFGPWMLFFHILGIIIPTDYYFSEGWLNHQPDYWYSRLLGMIFVTGFTTEKGLNSNFTSERGRKFSDPHFFFGAILTIALERCATTHATYKKPSPNQKLRVYPLVNKHRPWKWLIYSGN